MPGEILLINPRRKRSRRRPMSALQRKYFGRRVSHAARNPRRSPRRRVTRARRNPSTALSIPSPARRIRRRRSVRGRARLFRRRRSSGNISSFSGFTSNALMPAAIGAAGALALDMAWAHLPLPPTLMSGPLAPITRIAGAVGIGMLAGMVAGKKFGGAAMLGALTVTGYDLIKGYMTAAAPAPATTGAYVGMNAYVGDGMGYVGVGANA